MSTLTDNMIDAGTLLLGSPLILAALIAGGIGIAWVAWQERRAER